MANFFEAHVLLNLQMPINCVNTDQLGLDSCLMTNTRSGRSSFLEQGIVVVGVTRRD